jgi:hypothetical protein
MAISKMFSSKIWCDYGTFFFTKSLYELDWIFFGCEVGENSPTKK